MSELITVKRGFTLEETPPITLHHSQTDSVTSVTRQIKWPFKPDAHTSGYVENYPYGTFARQWDVDHWLPGLDFGVYIDSSQTLAPGGTAYTQTALRFVSLAESRTHNVSIRDLSTDPQNPQMHTFDIYDDQIGQIYPQFTAHIGYAPFSSYLPRFSFSAKEVTFFGIRASDGSFDWAVPTFDISLTYWTNHSYDPEQQAQYEVDIPTAYSYYNGINAAVLPFVLEQSEESHVITETITIDS